jgi:hypothetical protein
MAGDLRRFIQCSVDYQRWAAQALRGGAAPYRSPRIADEWMASAERAQNVLYQHRPRLPNVAAVNAEERRCQCGEPDWCQALRMLALEWAHFPDYAEHAREWQPKSPTNAPG